MKDRILILVSEYFSISVEVIFSRSQDRVIVRARQMVCLIAFRELDNKRGVARLFGFKDSKAIRYIIEVAQDNYDSSPSFKLTLDKLQSRL